MQASTKSPVRTPDIVQDEINALHNTDGLSFRRIARRAPYSKIGIPAGTLATIAKTGYIPAKYYPALGLPLTVEVQPVAGAIPRGSQVLTADTCAACGRPYISNHPRRRRCFICSPYRGRKEL